MKRILITGANSYIGTSFENWLARWPEKYSVDTVDVKEESWKQKDFSRYDVVFHVAGIAHVKETRANRALYYQVNRDLPFEVARKAKDGGVRQLIFLSSMSVYGLESGIIDEKTPLKPKSHYGRSKLEAEQRIEELSGDDFLVAILRPPMVYGKGCKGNYQRLAKLAAITPVFPDVDNRRSMIFVANLCEHVKFVVDNCLCGLFFPQNKDYVRTSEMVRLIAEARGKRVRLTRVFNPLLRFARFGAINKLFGDLAYGMGMGDDTPYAVDDFKTTILLTEQECCL